MKYKCSLWIELISSGHQVCQDVCMLDLVLAKLISFIVSKREKKKSILTFFFHVHYFSTTIALIIARNCLNSL